MEEEVIFHEDFHQYSNMSYNQQLPVDEYGINLQNHELVINFSSPSASSQNSYSSCQSHPQSIYEDENTQQSSSLEEREKESPSQNKCENSTLVLVNNNSVNVVEDQPNQMHKLQIVNIPLQKYLFCNREFLLNGDILMNFNHEDFQRIGTFNKYKKMAKLVIDKNIDQLNIHMTTFQKGVDHFGELIQFCSSQPNQTMYQIAQQLVRHQERVDRLKQFVQSISKMPNFQEFVQASEIVYQNFKQKCQAQLLQMIKDYTIKFYKTKFIKINYQEGTYEIEQMSMSQLLLAILGVSQEQAQQFIMRKGMFEFVFSLEEFGIELHCLSLYNENITKFSSYCMIKTFDGIDLQVNTNFHIFYNMDNTIARKGGILLTEFFIVVDYDITPNMLRQLVDIRKKEPNFEYLTQLENESDWDYAAQSKQFIQQFYPNKL
ncbi:hypothetical protein TTHERM_00299930 (macronuclear) [Tetrahymena thermophila SB210]|uniref:Uncharacterized protein n=1 Tax=Tetrahymena thermophila (strain SB210) TaxID=312017 RepID=I7MM69_TETTS|nr:hypothetical protein TTHERM_00299930 [Tetrahymena thermophila SB210]EAS04275.1 hypothetical protein TTHERM_00299930 [Tetrahymena thermophila SB210]|eukprot:XP_001024520.1 hypothetical protein TTHERM_00299930 [Tetrahymena thermophila SB210]